MIRYEVTRQTVFTFVAGAADSADILIPRGNYAHVHPRVNNGAFPITRHPLVTRTAETISFPDTVLEGDALRAFDAKGLLLPTWEDTFYLGAAYPDEPHDPPLVFFHEFHKDPKLGNSVLVIGGMVSRHLTLDPRNRYWQGRTRFVGIRPA